MNHLKIQKVRPFSLAYRQVKSLYLRAFPKEERLPLAPLIWTAYRPLADCYAYYDEDQFVGFAYLLQSAEQIFLLFLAVNDQVRSKGYGSQILADLKQKAGQRPLILTIEPLEQGAANLGQRQKRLAFYQRNGFQATEHFYHEGPEIYQILTNQEGLDLLALEKLSKKACLGLIPIVID